MAFGFHAGFVHSDDLVRRLSFADRDDQRGEHYFIIDRSENSPENAVADMANVYIERDDQGWGGYGGIERVLLERDNLTLKLEPRMATQIGQHDQIRITFQVKEPEFIKLREVLRLILRGYENLLECRA